MHIDFARYETPVFGQFTDDTPLPTFDQGLWGSLHWDDLRLRLYFHDTYNNRIIPPNEPIPIPVPEDFSHADIHVGFRHRVMFKTGVIETNHREEERKLYIATQSISTVAFSRNKIVTFGYIVPNPLFER